MPINVSEALDFDTSEIITVIRKTGGSYVDGIYVDGVDSSFKTLASVQQPTPQQMKILPENERNSDVRVFYCKKPVRTVSDKDASETDVLRYKGFNYRIIQLGDWDSYGHTIAFGARK